MIRVRVFLDPHVVQHSGVALLACDWPKHVF